MTLSHINRELAGRFDRLFTSDNIRKLEKAIVLIAVLTFMVHLGLIFFARQFGLEIPLINGGGQPSYLSAVGTPFNIILLFELLLLILAIPDSITRSIGRQYEIISLITILNVFKDIGKLDSLGDFNQQLAVVSDTLVEFGGAIAMFLLITVFYHIKKRRVRKASESVAMSIQHFVWLKKSMAMLLSSLFVLLILTNAVGWISNAIALSPISNRPFFVQLFTLMIFSDVLILIFSYVYTSHYELLIRNIGFILTTILLRISLTLSPPYSVGLALLAMAGGVVVHWVYNYFRSVDRRDLLDCEDDQIRALRRLSRIRDESPLPESAD